MGLEDLVNLILKPLEGVAQLVYDACFAEDIKKEVGKDGKVAYKVKYTEKNSLRPYFDKIKTGYQAGKKFVQEKVVRKLDQGYLYLEKFVNEYLYKPLVDFYNKNKALSLGLIGLGVYLII
jgi:hypothetical protein